MPLPGQNFIVKKNTAGMNMRPVAASPIKIVTNMNFSTDRTQIEDNRRIGSLSTESL